MFRGVEYDAPVARYYERLAAVQARGSQASHQVLRDILREVHIVYFILVLDIIFYYGPYKKLQGNLVDNGTTIPCAKQESPQSSTNGMGMCM